jgi:type IV secretion system protein VirB9
VGRDPAPRNAGTHRQHHPATGEYLGDLKFDYELSGSASWKPVRVFNDGRKTIIEMPGTMQQTEAPTLLVVRKEGGMFRDDETVLVNYRVQGNRYIVDTVFDRAILIAGVGGSQDRVTISRRK